LLERYTNLTTQPIAALKLLRQLGSLFGNQ
jgi:hypothetical protein